MSSVLPTTGFFADAMSAFFGYNQSVQSNLWGQFLAENGLTTDPSNSDPVMQQAFLNFVSGKYKLASELGISPEEAVTRHIIFSMLSAFITMLQTMTSTTLVTGNLLNYYGQLTDQYADEIGQIPIYTSQTSQTMSLDALVPGDTDIGFGNITLNDLATWMASIAIPTNDGMTSALIPTYYSQAMNVSNLPPDDYTPTWQAFIKTLGSSPTDSAATRAAFDSFTYTDPTSLITYSFSAPSYSQSLFSQQYENSNYTIHGRSGSVTTTNSAETYSPITISASPGNITVSVDTFQWNTSYAQSGISQYSYPSIVLYYYTWPNITATVQGVITTASSTSLAMPANATTAQVTASVLNILQKDVLNQSGSLFGIPTLYAPLDESAFINAALSGSSSALQVIPSFYTTVLTDLGAPLSYLAGWGYGDGYDDQTSRQDFLNYLSSQGYTITSTENDLVKSASYQDAAGNATSNPVGQEQSSESVGPFGRIVTNAGLYSETYSIDGIGAIYENYDNLGYSDSAAEQLTNSISTTNVIPWPNASVFMDNIAYDLTGGNVPAGYPTGTQPSNDANYDNANPVWQVEQYDGQMRAAGNALSQQLVATVQSYMDTTQTSVSTIQANISSLQSSVGNTLSIIYSTLSQLGTIIRSLFTPSSSLTG